MSNLAMCPGCGDRGDAAHMSACVVLKRDRLRADGWLAGAMHVISLVRVQLGRRGSVDVAKLVEAVEAVYGGDLPR